jgi:MFS family permease
MAEAVEAVRYVVCDPLLRALAVAYSLSQVAWGILLIVVPVAVAAKGWDPGRRDVVVGALWAACGLMATVGALVAGFHSRPGRERRLMIAGLLLSAVAICPAALSDTIAGLAVGLGLAGAMAGAVDVAVLGLRQRATDPTRLGSVLAISMSLNLSGLPLGSALAGIIAGHSRQAAWAAAIAAFLLAALTAYRLILRVKT